METFTNPWVIGIGATVIAGLILYYVFGIGKAKHKGRVSDEKPISNLLSKEITQHLGSLPPLQRDAATKNYKGIRVSWKVNLESSHSVPIRKLHLMMLNEGHYPWVICDVNPTLYPELRIMKEDRVFLIEGEIQSGTQGEIRLTNCQLRF